MLAGGIGLFTLGYALIWTGVQRFRGNNITLLESLGLQGAGKTNRVAGSGSGATPSADTSGTTNVVPATSTGTPSTGTMTA